MPYIPVDNLNALDRILDVTKISKKALGRLLDLSPGTVYRLCRAPRDRPLYCSRAVRYKIQALVNLRNRVRVASRSFFHMKDPDAVVLDPELVRISREKGGP